MSELINKEDALAIIAESATDTEAFEKVKALPSAENKGKWIDKGWTGDWQYRIDGRGNCWRDIRCSKCNTSVTHESNFCPNCGAKMGDNK